MTYGGNGARAVGDGHRARGLGRVAHVLPGDDGGNRAVGDKRVDHNGSSDGPVDGGRRDARPLGGSHRGREEGEEVPHLHLVYFLLSLSVCFLFFCRGLCVSCVSAISGSAERRAVDGLGAQRRLFPSFPASGYVELKSVKKVKSKRVRLWSRPTIAMRKKTPHQQAQRGEAALYGRGHLWPDPVNGADKYLHLAIKPADSSCLMTHCWYDKQTNRVVGLEKCFGGGTFQSACPAGPSSTRRPTRRRPPRIPSPSPKSTVQKRRQSQSGDPFS